MKEWRARGLHSNATLLILPASSLTQFIKVLYLFNFVLRVDSLARAAFILEVALSLFIL